jgi:sensor histidine kinase regulating citrate/malate metabolism
LKKKSKSFLALATIASAYLSLTRRSSSKKAIAQEGAPGYGLFLIKKMMEVYGWTIQEAGEPGKGVRFTITIPKTNQNGKENYLIA